MASLSRATLLLSALALACARGPTVTDGQAESCPAGRPGCAADAAESDEAAHLQLKEQQHGESVQCPGSDEDVMCAGDQCCPRTEESGWKTFPCPTASPGYDKCESPDQPSDPTVTVPVWGTTMAPSPDWQGGQSGCALYEVSELNYDYGGKTLQTVNAAGFSSCCQPCNDYGSGCGGWSYYGGVCYLKPPGQGSFYSNPGRRAGKKVFTPSGANMDLGGRTIKQVQVQFEGQCSAQCTAQPGCGGYSYYQNVCYLKPCGQDFYPHEGRVAAKKC